MSSKRLECTFNTKVSFRILACVNFDGVLIYGKCTFERVSRFSPVFCKYFRVVSQYQELVQNEAKCPVKMSHSSSGAASTSQLSPGEDAEVRLLPLCA